MKTANHCLGLDKNLKKKELFKHSLLDRILPQDENDVYVWSML
jgi:hypothetical protein